MSDDAKEDYKPRPRAADDVDVISARLAELRKERDAVLNQPPTMEDLLS